MSVADFRKFKIKNLGHTKLWPWDAEMYHSIGLKLSEEFSQKSYWWISSFNEINYF